MFSVVVASIRCVYDTGSLSFFGGEGGVMKQVCVCAHVCVGVRARAP